MLRPFAVFGLAFAGVLLLAGVGWALLAGAVLVCVLWRREPDWAAAWGAGLSWARRVAAGVAAAPRRAVAMTGMGGGLALLPAGLALWAGVGAGVAAAGGLLIGLSLLTGQGA